MTESGSTFIIPICYVLTVKAAVGRKILRSLRQEISELILLQTFSQTQLIELSVSSSVPDVAW